MPSMSLPLSSVSVLFVNVPWPHIDDHFGTKPPSQDYTCTFYNYLLPYVVHLHALITCKHPMAWVQGCMHKPLSMCCVTSLMNGGLQDSPDLHT